MLATLSKDDIDSIAARRLKRDDLVRDYVHRRFSYRYVKAPDGEIGRAVEADVRRGALGGIRPALNPL